jgi:hypothetical protein
MLACRSELPKPDFEGHKVSGLSICAGPNFQTEVSFGSHEYVFAIPNQTNVCCHGATHLGRVDEN